jgi:hypothetical protein
MKGSRLFPTGRRVGRLGSFDDQKDSTVVVLDHLRIRELKGGETFSSGSCSYQHEKEINWLAIYDWKNEKADPR